MSVEFIDMVMPIIIACLGIAVMALITDYVIQILEEEEENK